MDHDTAKKLHSKCLVVQGELNSMLLAAKDSCDPVEFNRLKKTVGGIMADLFLKITQNLYWQHPDLVPENLLRDNGTNPYVSEEGS